MKGGMLWHNLNLSVQEGETCKEKKWYHVNNQIADLGQSVDSWKDEMEYIGVYQIFDHISKVTVDTNIVQ